MARIVVTFRDIVLVEYPLREGVYRIGRNEDNDIVIDSLAVAPAHAELHVNNEGCRLRQLDESYPVLVNGKAGHDHTIHINDRIALGKHLLFIDNGVVQNKDDELDEDILNKMPLAEKAFAQAGESIGAKLQVMNGKHIGRVLPIRRPFARIGKRETGIAMIVRRHDGYYVSELEGMGAIKVNDAQVEEHALPLNDGDVLQVGKSRFRFHIEDLPSHPEETA